MAAETIELSAKIIFILMITLGFFSPVLAWLERKQSALMQDRIGANRASILGFTIIGLFHTLADTIKLLTKEDFVPRGANRFFHTLAPFISLTTALVVFAVIPFGGTYILFGHQIKLIIADLDVGLLYIFAFGSLSSYGTVLAGWSSNNNWSLLGGIRGAAQMLSYEIAMGLSIVGVLMVYETVSLHQIGTAQTNLLRWGVFTQPLAFIIFFVCGVAENKRIPFDIPEAESEIVAGYFTEYSGMKFIMFWMSEFLEVVIIAFLSTAIFLGAWHIPFVDELSLLDFFSTFTGENLANVLTMLIAVFVFMVKVCFMIVFQMTIRWTLPRFRYDQVMNLGWKILLPLSLINIVITGGIILL
jgi:NADH-quinone oxidoreductase subunit H